MTKILLLLSLIGLISCSSVYNDRGISSVEKQDKDEEYYERSGMAGRY